MSCKALTVATLAVLANRLTAAPTPTGQAVLEQNCSGCHAQTSPMGGLDLRTRESMLRGGRRGAAVIPGQAGKSLIIQAVEGAGDLKMPPGKKLPPEAIAALRGWIDAGAPWQQREAKGEAKLDDVWAFQPLRKSAGAASVDALISQKLGGAGLPSAPPADK